MSRPTSAIVDPGLQPERTDHAWRRTGFSFLAVGGLMLHMKGMNHELGFALAVPVLLFSIWVHRTGHKRYLQVVTAVRTYGVRGYVMGPRYIRIVAVAMVVLYLCAVLAIANAGWR